MVEFIFALIGALLALIGIFVWINASRKLAVSDNSYDEDGLTVAKWVGRGLLLIGVILFSWLMLASTLVFNGVGEAKVFINLDGTIARSQTVPGQSWKAPWQSVSDYDLFSQEVLYAGAPGNQPVYSGGTVSGAEVTVAVGGINGGSTQANLDISVTYSIDAAEVEGIYSHYRSQERFTKQVIEKTILSTIRQIPSGYNATDFRGGSRQEAADKILASLNNKLKDLGVTVDFVNIQDVRYPEQVETALKDVEVANQNVLKATADQKTAEVNAETARITAQGVADSNAILKESLTPEVLQQKYIDALSKGNTIYVVPDGSTPFIGTK